MFFKLYKSLAVVAAIALTACAAQAATVHSIAYDRADLDALTWIENPLATSTIISTRARAGVYEGVTHNLSRTYRTPWKDASRAIRRDAPFTAVRASTAIYDFDIDQIGLSLIWGSTGRRDTLSLFNDGVLVTTIKPVAGTASNTVPLVGNGAYFVTVSDTLFDEIRISNTRGTFEFANLQTVAAVPLPAGGALLLTALGGIALMRRKKG